MWKRDMFDNPGGNRIIGGTDRDDRSDEKKCGWYLENNEDIHSRISIRSRGILKGFPKTLIMTAEYDYLKTGV